MQGIQRKKKNRKKKGYRCRHNNLELFETFLDSKFEAIMIDYHEYASMKSCVESLRLSLKRYKYNTIISIHQFEGRVYLCRGRAY